MLAELRAEIERLSRELDLASTEKIQSAQYGLALLEEKSTLQERCNELEGLYENTKHELDITHEVSFFFFKYIFSVCMCSLTPIRNACFAARYEAVLVNVRALLFWTQTYVDL